MVVTWKRFVGNAAHDAVVHDETGLVQHQPVAAAADRKLRPAVRIEPVQELGRVGSHDLDLAESRGVKEARELARDPHFAVDGRVQVLAGLRKVPGAFPLTDILEPRTLGDGPGVDRSLTDGVEEFLARQAREGPEGDRRVGLAEGREADLGQRLAERAGRDGERIHVRRLALVGRHAGGGVALDMLDRAEAFADRELDVLGRDVVLEIDESLDARRITAVRQGTEHAARIVGVVARHRIGQTFLLGSGRGGACLGAFVESGPDPPRSRAGPDRALHLGRIARQVTLRLGVKAELAARLREEMNRGREAARHQKSVAGHGLVVGRPLPGRLGHGDGVDPHRPFGADQSSVGHHGQPLGAGGVDAGSCRARPHVDDTGDRDARRGEVERRPVGSVVPRHHHDAAAGLDAVAVEERTAGIGQHDAWPVVVREHEGPLGRTGGQDDVAGPDLPEPLARGVRQGTFVVVGEPLRQGDEVVVVIAEGLGARQ